MSSSSREYSPDWLRNVHQAPPIFSLSSSSDDDDQLPISSVILNNNPKTTITTTTTKAATTTGSNVVVVDSKNKLSNNTNKEKVITLSFFLLFLFPYYIPLPQEDHPKPEAEHHFTGDDNDTLPKQQDLQTVTTTTDNQTGPYISSSTLPLLLSDKIQRSKVLVECEGESIDLSGDLGSVGRVVISDSHQDMLLDLKGTIYKTTIIPSRTFCVVSFGQSEAKIEAIMNDFIQLKPQSNVYEAETMVEGTLEGFSFDSEDEGDKHTIRQPDENEGADPQTNRKGRGKSEKTSDTSKKKGKTAVKKPAAAAKKVKRKAPVAKRAKTKK